MLGSFEVTALYDGAIDLDEKLLKNIQQRDIQRLLAREFLKAQRTPPSRSSDQHRQQAGTG